MRFLLTVSLCLLTGSLVAEDSPLLRVRYENSSKQIEEVTGKVILTATDGGLLMLNRGGALHNITPAKLKEKEELQRPFQPYTQEEQAKLLREEFGEGFAIIRTKHYLLACEAGEVYGEWCGVMFERLYKAFVGQWKTSPLKLTEPEFPLVVIIFKNQQSFATATKGELGASAISSKGYYSVRSNRVMIYDLAASALGRPARNRREILQKMKAAPANVVTVIHEATHQIAFNTGVHQRYADNPLWLTEGLAMYFEAPDLRSSTGWRTVGKVNQFRIRQVKSYFATRRQPGSLASLISGDTRLREPQTVADAYAEAWVLTYFLMKTHRKQYEQYLEKISQKPRLIWDKPEQRLKDFQDVFGTDLEKLDAEFVGYVKRLR